MLFQISVFTQLLKTTFNKNRTLTISYQLPVTSYQRPRGVITSLRQMKETHFYCSLFPVLRSLFPGILYLNELRTAISRNKII